MDDEVLVGVELLDHFADLLQIATDLGAAKSLAEEAAASLGSGSTYYGKAQESMLLFVKQLISHIEKLQMFYGKAGQYAYVTYESFYQSDTALAAWLIKQTEGSEG